MSMSDEDLLQRLRQGDEEALGALIDRYSGYIAAVVRHTLDRSVQNEDVEELVSDAFVTLWRKAQTLAVDSNVKAWLAVVARNKALNWARAKNSRPVCVEAADVTTQENRLPESQKISMELNSLELIARNQLVLEALDKLDDESRGLIVSHYIEDRSIKDIAEATGFTEPAIKSRLFRSRGVMRKHLKQEGFAS
jgi:RNA polymerase sigma-70 factor (ECF subfamily)